MSGLKVGSVFSGVEGFGLGFEAAGFEVAWQIEIDKDATSVLERHYPNVSRYRDVTTVDPAEIEAVDVVTFGSPCQDMSVAGKRAGLAGERSGLFHEAVRVIGGLRPAPAFCLWENVPGALSSAGGRDFGAALDALASIGALDIAWRVLDARHFGVPQRRRRIFLVADFGAERAASVLFESASGEGDSEASGATGERSPGDAEEGAGGAGITDLAFTVPATAGRNDAGDRIGNAWNTTYVPELSNCLRASDDSFNGQKGARALLATANSVQASAGHHGHSSPRGDGSDNLVPIAIRVGQQGANGHGYAEGAAHALDAGGPVQAVAIAENIRAEIRETSYTNALGVGGGKPGQGYQAVREGLAVRRLTPRECERLMGFPDGWTRYRADGSEIPDGPRYRMIGNGVVAPVAAWIARRLRRVMEQTA